MGETSGRHGLVRCSNVDIGHAQRYFESEYSISVMRKAHALFMDWQQMPDRHGLKEWHTKACSGLAAAVLRQLAGMMPEICPDLAATQPLRGQQQGNFHWG